MDQDEFTQLLLGKSITETIAFGSSSNAEFCYCVQVAHHTENLTAAFNGNTITITVDCERLSDWAQSNGEGLYESQRVSKDTVLRIALEKDYTCLAAREGEDSGREFDNPNKNNIIVKTPTEEE